MRISDWSADVCSSDLIEFQFCPRDFGALQLNDTADAVLGVNHIVADIKAQRLACHLNSLPQSFPKIPLISNQRMTSVTDSVVQAREIPVLCSTVVTETKTKL